MSSYQAIVNSDNIVVVVSQTVEPLIGSEYIPISSYDVSLLGKKWNGETFEDCFVEIQNVNQRQSEVTEPQPILIISLLEFLRRFTIEERIELRSYTDPRVIDFMQLLNLQQTVNLTDVDTIEGVNYCESIGILAEGRASVILAPEYR